ncbi:MAG: hypothetical protein KKC19_03445 [Nanoarchaeota archaeon]|nr:hypothetical protein [Nanoarchaeota archaeon]
MTLQEMYPKEWTDLTNQKVPKDEIDEYLLNFVSRLLREVKNGKREEDDLGDGWSMIINLKEGGYNLNPEVYSFLFRLGDYGLEETLGSGDSEYGKMLYSPEEVEIELKRVAKKLGINLEL